MPNFEELVGSFEKEGMECALVTLGHGRLFVTYVILCFLEVVLNMTFQERK